MCIEKKPVFVIMIVISLGLTGCGGGGGNTSTSSTSPTPPTVPSWVLVSVSNVSIPAIVTPYGTYSFKMMNSSNPQYYTLMGLSVHNEQSQYSASISHTDVSDPNATGVISGTVSYTLNVLNFPPKTITQGYHYDRSVFKYGPPSELLSGFSWDAAQPVIYDEGNGGEVVYTPMADNFDYPEATIVFLNNTTANTRS